MGATVADVAKKVGKSYQVVSAVLNGGKSSSAASETTREKILKAAEQLGYRPNSAARAVSTGRFNAIGLLLSTATWKSNITGQMLAGIQDTLAKNDQHLMLTGFPDDTLTDRRLPKVLRHMLVDGLIIKYDCQIPGKMVDLIRAARLPVIWMNSKHPFDCVHPDDFEAGKRATEYLLNLGHRRIAFVDYQLRPEEDHYSSSDRRAGYVAAMKSAGLAASHVNEQPLVPIDERLSRIKVWLTGKNRATAVVSEGEQNALPVIHAASVMGLRVPEDLSVITFEDLPVKSIGVHVSTMLIPERELGAAAADMLCAKIERPGKKFEPKAIPFGFDPGKTCMSPAH